MVSFQASSRSQNILCLSPLFYVSREENLKTTDETNLVLFKNLVKTQWWREICNYYVYHLEMESFGKLWFTEKIFLFLVVLET